MRRWHLAGLQVLEAGLILLLHMKAGEVLPANRESLRPLLFPPVKGLDLMLQGKRLRELLSLMVTMIFFF